MAQRASEGRSVRWAVGGEWAWSWSPGGSEPGGPGAREVIGGPGHDILVAGVWVDFVDGGVDDSLVIRADVFGEDEIAAFALSEPSILREANEHDRWADIEAAQGGSQLERIA